MSGEPVNAVELAEAYYDSSDADNFYMKVWGGEDIHIGLYEPPDLSIREASRRTVIAMADRLKDVGPQTRVLDLGAGYGGAARYLAERFGCQVTCLNLSETQNAHNRRISAEAGLGEKVVVEHGNFEAIPEGDATFDVVWSQDAILHSGDRPQVLREARRVLRPRGQLLFTDPMQSENAPPSALTAVLQRIHLDTMGSLGFYERELSKLGFAAEQVTPLTQHLVTHYSRVRSELLSRRGELDGVVSTDYVERMLVGLQHWVDAGNAGNLAWGIMHYRLPT